jgi:hypothetical protein
LEDEQKYNALQEGTSQAESGGNHVPDESKGDAGSVRRVTRAGISVHEFL